MLAFYLDGDLSDSNHFLSTVVSFIIRLLTVAVYGSVACINKKRKYKEEKVNLHPKEFKSLFPWYDILDTQEVIDASGAAHTRKTICNGHPQRLLARTAMALKLYLFLKIYVWP